jgi:hypothetical protein
MGTKVEELVAEYSAKFEEHLHALDSGYQRSLNGHYGARDWFQDVALAGKRARDLTLVSWELVFPSSRRLPLRVRQGTAAVSEVFSIGDPYPTSVPATMTLISGMDSIDAKLRLVGQDREKLVVDIDTHLSGKPVTPVGTPYAGQLLDGAGRTLFKLELHIVAP